MLTQERLKYLLTYNPDTGDFIWNMSRSWLAKKGDKAGFLNYGYKYIRVDKLIMACHRLAFLYVEGKMPPNDVDHINGIKDDNRWLNLRKATKSQNLCNRGIPINNSTGFKGVTINKDGIFCAEVRFKGKRYRKKFKDLGEANNWAESKREEIHGVFHRNN